MGGKTGPTKNPKSLRSRRKGKLHQSTLTKRSRLSRPLTPSLLEVKTSGWGGTKLGRAAPHTETPEQPPRAKERGLGAPAQMPQWWWPRGAGAEQLRAPALEANRLGLCRLCAHRQWRQNPRKGLTQTPRKMSKLEGVTTYKASWSRVWKANCKYLGHQTKWR
eukprot:4961883-Amphidinium_carterae.1